jgi:hypothetical protein
VDSRKERDAGGQRTGNDVFCFFFSTACLWRASISIHVNLFFNWMSLIATCNNFSCLMSTLQIINTSSDGLLLVGLSHANEIKYGKHFEPGRFLPCEKKHPSYKQTPYIRTMSQTALKDDEGGCRKKKEQRTEKRAKRPNVANERKRYCSPHCCISLSHEKKMPCAR